MDMKQQIIPAETHCLVNLDLTTTMGDLTRAMRNNEHDLLRADREGIEKRLGTATNAAAKITNKLASLSVALAKNQKTTKPDAAAAALNEMFGTRKRFRVKREGNPVRDDEKKTVAYEVIISDASGGYSSSDISKTCTVRFTVEMKRVLKQRDAANDVAHKIQQELTAVNRSIAKLPQFEDRCHTALVKAQLSGQLTDSRQIQNILEGVPRMIEARKK